MPLSRPNAYRWARNGNDRDLWGGEWHRRNSNSARLCLQSLLRRVVSNKKKFETRVPHIHVHIHTHRTRRFHAGHIITPRRRVRRFQASSRGSKPSHEAASSIRGRPQSSFLRRFTFKFRSVYVGPHYPSHSAPVLRTLWRRRGARRLYHSSCIPCDLHGYPAQHAQCRER